MRWKACLWLAVDAEATGVEPEEARIFEVGFAVGRAGGLLERRSFLLDPGCRIPAEVEALTGVKTYQVAGRPRFSAHAPLFRRLLQGVAPVLVGYNALEYDLPLLRAEYRRVGEELEPLPPVLDPLVLARRLYRRLPSFKLEALARHLGVRLEMAHRAGDDAAATLLALAAMARDLPDGLDAVLAFQEEARGLLARERERYGWWLREVDGGLAVGCGKHAGRDLAEMDPGYLRWALGLPDLPEGARAAFAAELSRREQR